MSSDQNQPVNSPVPIIRWESVVQDEAGFRALVKEDDTSRTPAAEDLLAHEHALRCQQCQYLLPLEPCPHCGGTYFVIRPASYNQVGLFCRTCTRSYTNTQCTCGTVIPLGHKTLLKKTLVKPVPPMVIVRWVAIIVVAIVLLYILF